MHNDARFWALFVAIAVGLFLAVVNIVTKIDLLLRLSD
jgi:hypothetical protein